MQFGFSQDCCDLIFQCVSTTSIAVLLNGKPCQFFKPIRGLRDGDPLSPYLFILCMEVFPRLILANEASKHVHGIKMTRNSQPISHLLFVDDCLLFAKADLEECRNLLNIIEQFSKASGQLIYFNKSGLFFSKKVHPRHQRMMSRLLKIKKINIKDAYLGDPLFIDKSKLKTFNALIEKMENKIQGWRSKILTHASRIVLIRHVLSSIPTFQMGCFRFPKKLTKKMNDIQRDFWWGKDSNSKGVYIKSYSFLCKPIARGGLGFREPIRPTLPGFLRWIEDYWMNLILYGQKILRPNTSLNALPLMQSRPRRVLGFGLVLEKV